jgi:murein L,D-transpeptidase YcbB/YkuD
MKRYSKPLLSLLLISALSLQADWTESLGELQKSDSVKKSYLVGMLTQQSYGIYKVDKINSKNDILELYEKNGNRLYWFDESKILSIDISNMIEAIKQAGTEGLDPERYSLQEIEFLYKKMSNGVLFDDRDYNLAATKLDILLSDAFLTLTKDLTQSQIDVKKFANILYQKSEEEGINYRWENRVPNYNFLALLEEAKSNGNFSETIYALAPNNTIYNNLKDVYQRYKTIQNQGGFVKIPKSRTLKLGMVSNIVPKLRSRLMQSEDLEYSDGGKKFDKALQNALKRFQKRVGLWASGVLNSTTRTALNVSVEKRLSKIKLNLERARLEKDDLSGRYIIANIPEFMMRFLDGSQELLKIRIVVGKPKNPTPIFQAKMSYVVLNPRWSVPNSIVAKEMLTKIQENPYYLEERNYKMYDSWKKDRKAVDSFDVDWFQYDEESKIPFNIVQEPGGGNPLGNVKFMFPNNHAVYMHDTTQKKLFKKSVRAFSHGCIRLQEPQKLLEFISSDYLGDSYESIKEKLKTGENQSLSLNDKIPVYIRYYTAFVDEFGSVHFGKDIYGYDKIAQKLLGK